MSTRTADVEGETSVEEIEVPDWSGVFIETLGEEYGMMMVSNFDERQHRPPPGWQAARHFTSPDGDFEVYTFVRADA